MLSIIVAKAENDVIGKDNKLVWRLPEDLKRFKQLTTGHTIIMGRKTFESLGRVLPNRKHVVLTKNINFKVDDPNVEIIHNISEIQKYVEDDEENFVIGGSSLYNILMKYASKMYVTEIHKDFDGDTFFPNIDYNVWTEVERQKGIKDDKNNLDYDFVIYKKN